ncbi:MAG: exo-alpha-sialidase [Pirellulaceae bacterium]|nr:exo-alpha-sialidase [Planctomycetales bacterium]
MILSRVRSSLVMLCLTFWSSTALVTEAQVATGRVEPEGEISGGLHPEIVDVHRIWEAAPHNAFTDLVHWNGALYCAFREGEGHAGDLGKLRVIVSSDGEHWKSAAWLSMEQFDLRDAALSITPDNRLMVLGGAQQQRDGKRETGTFVSFSADGQRFTDPQIVVPPGRWLWRVSWHGDTAYGVSYGANDDQPHTELLSTKDGTTYDVVSQNMFDRGGWPTEARVRFDNDGTAYCLQRRDGDDHSAYFGIAKSPYEQWQWHDLGVRIGGPNFVKIPSGDWIAAGRLYDGKVRTELLYLDVAARHVTPILQLPSGGDTSYPGMLWHDGMLWVSYYASHEGKTSIYLARVRFPGVCGNVIDVGNRLEPFVDRHLVSRMTNAELRMHEPVPAEAVLKFDRP